jgi:hypothetical protein
VNMFVCFEAIFTMTKGEEIFPLSPRVVEFSFSIFVNPKEYSKFENKKLFYKIYKIHPTLD